MRTPTKIGVGAVTTLSVAFLGMSSAPGSSSAPDGRNVAPFTPHDTSFFISAIC